MRESSQNLSITLKRSIIKDSHGSSYMKWQKESQAKESSAKTKNEFFIFNDVKNWKESVERNKEKLNGTSLKFATINN